MAQQEALPALPGDPSSNVSTVSPGTRTPGHGSFFRPPEHTHAPTPAEKEIHT